MVAATSANVNLTERAVKFVVAAADFCVQTPEVAPSGSIALMNYTPVDMLADPDRLKVQLAIVCKNGGLHR